MRLRPATLDPHMDSVLDGHRAFRMERRATVLGPDSGKQFKSYARMGSAATEVAVATVLGILGGQWLDKKLSTGPYLTLLGLLLGVVAGMRSLIRAARKEIGSSTHEPQDESDDKSDT
jgi:ATP synthase protein I